MKIPAHIPHLWYEDKDGHFLGEPDYQKDPISNRPKDAYMQVSEFPFQLRTTYLQLIRDKSGKVTSSKQICAGESGWSDDLVCAMIRGDKGHQPMTASRAIQVSAKACERCVNSLGHEYGLTWGYPEYGPEWQRAHTSCQWCDETKSKKKVEAPYKLRVGDKV